MLRIAGCLKFFFFFGHAIQIFFFFLACNSVQWVVIFYHETYFNCKEM